MIDVKRLAVDADYWDEVAPLGSTHYWEPSGDWYQDCGDYALTWTFGKKEWVQTNAPLRIVQPEVIPRPQPQTEWADALPPEGVGCEMADAIGRFIEVHIIANFDGYAFGWSYDQQQVYFSKEPKEFRPILTPEQRQRDELAGIIEKFCISAGSAEPVFMQLADAILSRYTLEPKP